MMMTAIPKPCFPILWFVISNHALDHFIVARSVFLFCGLLVAACGHLAVLQRVRNMDDKNGTTSKVVDISKW